MADPAADQSKREDFVKWARLKAEIHFTRDEKNMFFQSREIWWASLGINIGDEEDGKNFRFERPILIIKKFNRRLALIVPLSSRLKDNIYYYHFSFGNESRSVIISQIRLISSKRFIRRIGRLSRLCFKAIVAEVKNCF